MGYLFSRNLGLTFWRGNDCRQWRDEETNRCKFSPWCHVDLLQGLDLRFFFSLCSNCVRKYARCCDYSLLSITMASVVHWDEMAPERRQATLIYGLMVLVKNADWLDDRYLVSLNFLGGFNRLYQFRRINSVDWAGNCCMHMELDLIALPTEILYKVGPNRLSKYRLIFSVWTRGKVARNFHCHKHASWLAWQLTNRIPC